MGAWYQSKDEVISLLKSNEKGLTNKEADNRILKYGLNKLPSKRKASFIKIFFKQLLDPIIILLLITVFFCIFINEYIDAIAITFIIMVDLIMGAFQEWKANKTANSLERLINVNTRVIREDTEEEIDSAYLVPGDIVLIESGNKISADMRILESHNLQVDEASLTGESLNEAKFDSVLDENTPLADRENMVYAGTVVVTGRAKCIVINTGQHTEIGKIAHEVNSVKEAKSPLTIRMEKFSKQISILVVVIALIIALALVYKGVPGSEIFLSVIALSVSAMPEGLPLSLTMALTIGSNKMMKKNVIVKKLNSVESLGSCTVIASDKTGTLTVDEQTAKKVVLPNNSVYDITGTGYNDKGEIIGNDKYKKEVLEIASLGYLNNEAGLEESDNSFIYYGDSIDIAFLAFYKKSKADISNIEIIEKIPYESENKYSAIFYKKDGELRCTVKGSIEKVMSFCNRMNNNKKIDTKLLLDQNQSLAKNGYRVIAVADGKVNSTGFKESDIKELVFKGMVGFIDPVRDGVKESLKECKTAGIKVVMITGDHPLTAFAIAKDLKLASNFSEVTTGEEVEKAYLLGEEEFDSFVMNKTVFTRVTPIDKLRIVDSYKRQGEFIAVTGDGVNDAPALKSANIGIAMGSGTDVAKETASMIILDNSFKSIVAGIKEGRTAYSNIRKVCYMLLSCAVAEILFFLLSIVANLPMPLVAIQLLWLNIVTDGLQDFALSFEKSEKGIMKEKPRSPKDTIFNSEMLSEVILSGIVIGLIVFGVWVYLINYIHMDEMLARGYIMVLMVFIQNIHVFNCRSERESAFKVSLKNNPLVLFSILSAITLQIIVMEVPLFSEFLQVKPIPLIEIMEMLIYAFIVLIVMEIYKIFKRRI